MKTDQYADFSSFRDQLRWMCREYSSQKAELERCLKAAVQIQNDTCAPGEMSWEELDIWCRCFFCRETVEPVEEIMDAVEKLYGEDMHGMIYEHLIENETMKALEDKYHLTRRQLMYKERKCLEGVYAYEKNSRRYKNASESKSEMQKNRTDRQGKGKNQQ